MKISIITPVYNVEKYICRCIESVINQSYNDYELILIDDGSLDDSGKICDAYSKNNYNIHTLHQKNCGPGKSRNAGLARATGDYVIFLDSDDFICNNTLEILSKCAKENNYPDAILFDYFMGTEESNVRRSTITGAAEGFVDVKYAILNSSGGSCCKMYKRETIKKNSINFPDLPRKEDFVFNKVALSYCDTVFYIKLHMYFYFNNANSIMHTTAFSEDNQQSAFAILNEKISLRYKELVNLLKINNYLISALQSIFINGNNIRQIKSFISEFEKDLPNWYKKSKEINLTKETNIYLFLLQKKQYIILKIVLTLRLKIKEFYLRRTEE